MITSIREILNGEHKMSDFYTFNDIVNQYIPSRYYDRTNTNSGSNNTVHTYTLNQEKNLPKKISIRLAHYETIYYDNYDDTFKLNISPDEDIEDTIIELEQSKYNWEKSSEYRISPEIYFYGYVKDNHSKSLYLAIISEGYDTNLQEYYNDVNNQGYYNKLGGILTTNDMSIANQLNALFNTMHNKLKIICFDIKPANCVINIDTNEVRLIDWDGDWCKNYKRILSGRGDSQNSNISILSKILMANHFYSDLGSGCSWNIFSDYFLNNLYGEYGIGQQLTERKKGLEYLFCELKDSEYMRMARHYFGFDDNVECPYIFKKLFKRCRKLKPPTHDHYGGKKKKRSKRSKRKNTIQKKKAKKTKKTKKTKKSHNTKKNRTRKHVMKIL